MVIAAADLLTRLLVALTEWVCDALAGLFGEPDQEREALAIWDRLGRS